MLFFCWYSERWNVNLFWQKEEKPVQDKKTPKNHDMFLLDLDDCKYLDKASFFPRRKISSVNSMKLNFWNIDSVNLLY